MRFVKEYSLQYQKFVVEEDGVEPHEVDEALENMDRIGQREVEAMAKWVMESPYFEKGKSHAPKGGKPKQYNTDTSKGFGSEQQWALLKKLGVDTNKVRQYDDIQLAIKNPENYGGEPKQPRNNYQSNNNNQGNKYNAQKNIHGVSTTEKQRETLVGKMGVDIDKIETKDQVQDAFKNPGRYQ